MSPCNFFLSYTFLLLLSIAFSEAKFLPDDWNFRRIPRSTNPLLKLKDFVEQTESKVSDFILTQKLELIKKKLAETQELHTILQGKLFHWNKLTYDIEKVAMPCFLCEAGAKTLLFFIKIGTPEHIIIQFLTSSCSTLRIQTATVCEGIINEFASDLIYILKRAEVTPTEICSFFYNDACIYDVFGEKHNWEVSIPPKNEPTIPKERPIPKEAAAVLKVLHIADYHFDPYYEAGSNAVCDNPLCCRSSSGKPANRESGAGKWGDYRKCDTPKSLVDSMFEHIIEKHKDIDYILWTGDSPPHDIWNQTKSGNLQIIKQTLKHLTDSFPDIPIFPALGNHESAPVNSFPPPYIDQKNMSIAWLYEELVTLWQQWLPETATETIRKGAFYSVLLRPGLRLISLNMNYCNNLNWWMLFNATDPADQLQWFISELQNAELSNEKVHVIGHIPPGSGDCLKVWSRNFYDIIARFEHTVVAQFYGHTHFDEFEVFYDPKNWSHATNIAYIGPSVSPYEQLNPGYRIYYIDGDHSETTRSVVDHETWIMDLQIANSEDINRPNWYKLYSARNAYGMNALRPADWDEFIERMNSNRSAFEQYYQHYWKNSPTRPTCEIACQKRLICDSKSGRSHDRRQFCKELDPSILIRSIKKGTLAIDSLVNFIMDIF